MRVETQLRREGGQEETKGGAAKEKGQTQGHDEN